MAGWSMVADGSVVDSGKRSETQKNLEPKEFWIELQLPSKESNKSEPEELRCRFDRSLLSFFKEIYPQDTFRPLPPMLGDAQSVDLLKLFLVVREKGGYDTVSKSGLWDSVAQELGLRSATSSSVKLVYVKYLDALERVLEKFVDDKRESKSKSSDSGLTLSGHLMELKAGLNQYLSDSKTKDECHPHLEEMNCVGGEKCVDDEESMHIDLTKRFVDHVEVSKLCDDAEVKSTVVDLEGDKNFFDIEVDSHLDDVIKSVVNSSEFGKVCNDDDVKSDGGKKFAHTDKEAVLSSHEETKERSSRKRRQENVWEMLKWVTGVATNPCDSAIGSLPEKSKWKSYGKGELWKQVLSYREAVVLKRPVDDLSGEQSISQKNQRMHPAMYEDHGPTYNLRDRLSCKKKLFMGKTASQAGVCSQSFSSVTQNDSNKGGMGNHDDKELVQTTDSSTIISVLDYEVEKPIPIGPSFQAEVPEWTGEPSESDSKWLGTRVWPLEKAEKNYLLERDRIGKGRQDSCGCQVQASIDCVRFHIAEKRYRLKLELGSAFHIWKFDKMGEEAMLSWTEGEQKKFRNIVRLNPPSLDKCFWDQILKSFAAKSREELVCYYFNVFLLQRRAHQNRFTPNSIDSDDDDESESEIGQEATKTSSSIFHSPNKKHRKSR